MTMPPDPAIVLSDSLSGLAPIPGVAILRWSNFAEELRASAPAWAGPPVLAAFLTAAEARDLDAAAAGLLSAMGAEVVPVNPAQAARSLLSETARLLAAHAAAMAASAHQARVAMAEVRAHHARLQADHAELEAWLHDALAPGFKLARQWPPTAATALLTPEAPLVQPLPVPARGTVSLDLHLAESTAAAATLTLTLARPSGGQIAATAAAIHAGEAGWVRLSLPTPPGGPPQDAVAILSTTAPLTLSLGPETSFADLRANGHPAPLALRVYQTTARMTLPPLHDPRGPLPADGTTRLIQPRDLGQPHLLPWATGRIPRALRAYPDSVETRRDDARDAILVRPSARRPVVARLPGLTVERLTQLRATVQIARHDTMEVQFALGAAPSGTVSSARQALAHLGDWVALLPAQWGECWCEPEAPLEGPLDLLLATAMPNAPFNTNAEALFRGFRAVGA